MITILQKENKKLREVARPVSLKEITSAKVGKIIADMKSAMHSQDDAVAIAAPQIGVPLRIFVISGKVFAKKIKTEEGKGVFEEPLPPDLIFINPKLIKRSKKEVEAEEGCLSVRWWYGDVRRAEKVSVRAYDERGVRFTRGTGGLLAQIFQHEIDHLNRVLFIDKAKNLREVKPDVENDE